MSTQTVTNKRKSTGDVASAAKKVKTGKSADKPAPRKSALKQPKPKPAPAKVVEAKVKPAKAVEAKAKPAKVVEAKAKPAKVVEAKAKPAKVVEAKAKPAKPVQAKAVKAKAVKAAEPVAADDEAATAVVETLVEDAAEGGAELTEDQTAALLAGFSSSEDEASDDEEEGIAINKLPQAPRIKDIQKQIKAATTADPERTPGVIYVGRIPHGFFEHQMRAYFSQFGDILHIRLARNRKTGKSQHYGFIEFASAAVAEIVAKTMDKYLLFSHILQVRTVPQEQVKENMWRGSGRRKKPAPRNRLEGSKLRRGMVREDWDKKIERESRLRAEKAEKLKELGYDFDMPALKAASEVPLKPKQVEDVGAPTEQADGGAELPPSNVEVEQPVTEVVETVRVETVQVDANGASTVKKTTKKRASTEGKAKKAKKVKA
ncbi:hypothetical protein LTR36_008189 [Oleoguttula mirabilis]|uniref:RRM domain-containing protein n=1 Tax=Oleoguttula mirabilis TaxID=1507867 RepID=A0AAV9J955_9PEZI|nr:hypothetical protein LTR36_008189 [Oleoguttula mirabilis]